MLDRFHGGGATAISGGVFYAGGGTHIQQEAGVEDDADAMYRYLSLEVKGVVSDETLRDFCDRSVENLGWLEGHGVPFEASLCPYKTSYPTDDYYLYYSGNEGFAPFKGGFLTSEAEVTIRLLGPSGVEGLVLRAGSFVRQEVRDLIGELRALSRTPVG